MIWKAGNEIYLLAMLVLGLTISECDFWIRVKDLKIRFCQTNKNLLNNKNTKQKLQNTAKLISVRQNFAKLTQNFLEPLQNPPQQRVSIRLVLRPGRRQRDDCVAVQLVQRELAEGDVHRAGFFVQPDRLHPVLNRGLHLLDDLVTRKLRRKNF